MASSRPYCMYFLREVLFVVDLLCRVITNVIDESSVCRIGARSNRRR